jgi:hypothetical protein
MRFDRSLAMTAERWLFQPVRSYNPGAQEFGKHAGGTSPR